MDEPQNGQREDDAIAAIVQKRDREDTGERLTLEELAESVGLEIPEDDDE